MANQVSEEEPQNQEESQNSFASETNVSETNELEPLVSGPNTDRCAHVCSMINGSCSGLLTNCQRQCEQALNEDQNRLANYACLSRSCNLELCLEAPPRPISESCASFCEVVNQCDLPISVPTNSAEDCALTCAGLQQAGATNAVALRCTVDRVRDEGCEAENLESCFSFNVESACHDVCRRSETCPEDSAFAENFGDQDTCRIHCLANAQVASLVAFGACIDASSCAGSAHCASITTDSLPICLQVCDELLRRCEWDLESEISTIDACAGTCLFYDSLSSSDAVRGLTEVSSVESCQAIDDIPPVLARLREIMMVENESCQTACSVQAECYSSPVRDCVAMCTTKADTDPNYALFLESCLASIDERCDAASCLGH